MTKKIGLFAFTLLLLISTGVVSVDAYVEQDVILEPDVFCDPELGCLNSETVESPSYSVVYYTQKRTSDPDYRLIYMHTDFGVTHCSYNLYYAGCAVASMTMLLNYYRGYTDQQVSLTSVNDTVQNSCDYAPSRFVNAYPNDVSTTYSSTTEYTNKVTVFNLLGPKLDSNHLAIVGVKTSAGATHFVLVTGYTKTTSVFENGTIINYSELKVKDPADTTRTTLSSVLNYYPIVYRMAVYNNEN